MSEFHDKLKKLEKKHIQTTEDLNNLICGLGIETKVVGENVYFYCPLCNAGKKKPSGMLKIKSDRVHGKCFNNGCEGYRYYDNLVSIPKLVDRTLTFPQALEKIEHVLEETEHANIHANTGQV